jgi:hypothetical protein
MKKLIILFLLIPFILLAGEKRSSEWNKVRKEHLRKNPICVVCGSESDLIVHHIIPFSIDKELELAPTNLITGCTSKKFGFNCHSTIFHAGSFKNYNPWILEDIDKVKEIIERTQCQKNGCLNNDGFVEYTKFIKKRVDEFMCKEYGKCVRKK